MRADGIDVKERPKLSDSTKRRIQYKATKQVDEILHWGKNPRDVHMRHLGGWDSASKLRFSWFLTTMTLFQFVPVRGTNLFEMMAIPDEIRRIVDNYSRGELVPGAKRDPDIERYLSDIHLHGDETPRSGDATDLGRYTLIRHWQLKMKGQDTSGRESVSYPDTMDVAPQEEISLDHGYKDTFPRYGIVFEEFGTEFARPEDEYSELSFSADDLEHQPSAEAEDQTNFPLAALLSSTTMCCNEAKLDWNPIKTDIDIHLGNARLHAINDGSLRNGLGWLLATTEVKRRRLCSLPQHHPRQTMIQMGMELLVHVLDCEQKGIVKDRYHLVCEHFDEMFFFFFLWTEHNQQYVDYATGKTEPSPLERPFFNIKFAGPFNIYRRSHMRVACYLNMAMTIKESRDEEKRLEEH